MIFNIVFACFFLLMVCKPKLFNMANDEYTGAKVTKIMRICGIVGLVCVVVMTVMQLKGLV